MSPFGDVVQVMPCRRVFHSINLSVGQGSAGTQPVSICICMQLRMWVTQMLHDSVPEKGHPTPVHSDSIRLLYPVI